MARRGILRLCVGSRSSHSKEKDNFKDVRRKPTGLTLKTVEKTQKIIM